MSEGNCSYPLHLTSERRRGGPIGVWRMYNNPSYLLGYHDRTYLTSHHTSISILLPESFSLFTRILRVETRIYPLTWSHSKNWKTRSQRGKAYVRTTTTLIILSKQYSQCLQLRRLVTFGTRAMDRGFFTIITLILTPVDFPYKETEKSFSKTSLAGCNGSGTCHKGRWCWLRAGNDCGARCVPTTRT